MSAPEREQLEAIVRTVHREWIAAVGERPALGESAAEQLFDLGLFGAARARELGVIDGCAYEDELEHELGLSDGQHALPHIRYLRRSGDRPRLFVPLRRRSRIALLRLAGPIAERVRSSGIDLHGTVRTLRRLAGDARIVGVILHIDSPGGSALVSELLHREIERLNREKPVVTWMGNVAASGGYYLACASRAIVAQPTTLTGSIGVVSLRPVAEQLLEHLRIRRDLVGITRYADLHSVVHRPSADEEALLRAETGRFYERFLEVVAHGRKRAVDEIRALAEGRVWSGRDAHRCGLVDALGGYHEARSLLDALLGAEGKQAEREPIVVSLPRRAVAAPLAASAQGAAGLGEFAPLAELLAFGMCRERVLAYALGLPRLR